MTNIEKVIKHLRVIYAYMAFAHKEGTYFFGQQAICDIKERASDALELLKEQEAVEPEVEVLNEIDRLYRCPKCHKCFFYEKQKYCDLCGQAVKWE